MKHSRFAPVDTLEQRRLGMAECGWRGLAEGWLLRHLGDVHWRLIAAAMGQQEAVFADATGAAVYAAFCAISEHIPRPDLARPGAVLTIGSRLRRLSATRLISFHQLQVGGAVLAEVMLVSTFIRHGETGGNGHILRTQPQGDLVLPMMEAGADRGFVAEAAGLYRSAPTALASAGKGVDVTPCPTTDFNAAGLLYCATYPALVDRAEWVLWRDVAQDALTRRTIVFLGNVDAGETVTATLARKAGNPGHVATLASQGRVIARVVTEKLS